MPSERSSSRICRNNWRRERKIQARGSIENSDGSSIAYTLFGEGSDTPLCFCPGLGGTQLGFESDASYFAGNGFRVLTLDLRGLGESKPPVEISRSAFTLAALATDVIVLLDELNISRVDFVGNSLGGVVGLELIRSHPDRVRSLITFGTTYHLNFPKLTVSVQYWVNRIIGPKRLPSFIAKHATTFDEPKAVIREMFEGYPVDVGRCIGYAIHKYDYRDVATKWVKPILLIKGGLDTSINGQLESTIDAISECTHVQIEQVPDAGHFLNLDQPDSFRRIVSGFLTRNFKTNEVSRSDG